METGKVERYPVDYDALRKGDIIPTEQLIMSKIKLGDWEAEADFLRRFRSDGHSVGMPMNAQDWRDLRDLCDNQLGVCKHLHRSNRVHPDGRVSWHCGQCGVLIPDPSPAHDDTLRLIETHERDHHNQPRKWTCIHETEHKDPVECLNRTTQVNYLTITKAYDTVIENLTKRVESLEKRMGNIQDAKIPIDINKRVKSLEKNVASHEQEIHALLQEASPLTKSKFL